MTDAPAIHGHSPRRARQAGLAAMILAMALLPVGDAIAKSLTSVLSSVDVAFGRMVMQALFFVPILLVMRRRMGEAVLSWPALVSAALLLTIALCLITAFSVMPIATAIAIFFVEPLLLTLLAGPLLGEVPGPRRYAAVAVGLVGALIVIRPNFAVFGPVVLLPLLAALGYALNMVVVRRATATRSALGFQIGVSFWAAGLAVAGFALLWLLGRPLPEVGALPGWALWLFVAGGALGALTFLAITFAFKAAEASLLAPLQYLEIVGAVIVGYLVFDELPDAATILGTAIILASGIYVFHRERVTETEGAGAQPAKR
jgi:drug/metabolite transporter (DMT)-like permease